MTMFVSREWYEKTAEIENLYGGSIDAGLMASYTPSYLIEKASARKRHVASINFYCFVHFSRRKRNMSLAELAYRSKIDFNELISLERDTQFKLNRESVIKLAKFFDVNEEALIDMARLDEPYFDPNWEDEVKQFPHNVGSTEELNEFEQVVADWLEKVLERQASESRLNYAA